MYHELKLDRINDTLARLRDRIEERFPGSGLGRVAQELVQIGEETGPIVEQLRRPNLVLRAFIGLAVLLMLALCVMVVRYVPQNFEIGGLGEFLQATESALQDIVFLGIACWFLLTLEMRLHRRVSLRELHRLRSIVHIVDMHQLTKDPESLLTPGMSTASSPARRLSRFELSRYLDYCTELLALASKLAAVHSQYINDPVVLAAVNDVESLAANLSNKIWQKIVILDTALTREHAQVTS